MSTINSPASYPAPVQQPESGMPVRGNGFGVTALVLGILSGVFSFIPVMGVAAFILGPLAIVFGIVGVTRKFARKGAAVAGLVLGLISIVIAAVGLVVLSSAVSSADQALNSEHTVEYVVTTNGKASVRYWAAGGTSTEDVTAGWQKVQTVKNSDFLSLVVSGDFMNAEAAVGCEILFDGKSIANNTGTGQGAMASCNGSGLGSAKK